MAYQLLPGLSIPGSLPVRCCCAQMSCWLSLRAVPWRVRATHWARNEHYCHSFDKLRTGLSGAASLCRRGKRLFATLRVTERSLGMRAERRISLFLSRSEAEPALSLPKGSNLQPATAGIASLPAVARNDTSIGIIAKSYQAATLRRGTTSIPRAKVISILTPEQFLLQRKGELGRTNDNRKRGRRRSLQSLGSHV